MKTFFLGLVLGVLLGLAACTTPTPAPTAVPTLPPPTNTVEVKPTDTVAPPTNTSAPATEAPTQSTATVAPTATLAPTDTPAPTNTPAPQTYFITYQDFSIVPAETTLRVGDTVNFLIRAGFLINHQPYNFTAPNVFEAPGGLGDGTTYTYTFKEAGTVTILCGYHPDMKATVIVQP
jgi:plastocyanin